MIYGLAIRVQTESCGRSFPFNIRACGQYSELIARESEWCVINGTARAFNANKYCGGGGGESPPPSTDRPTPDRMW